MQVNSASSGTPLPVEGRESFAKARQSFQKLGSALESGNLTDAKEAFANLQKDAPAPPASQGNNPISSKIEVLSKALNSGDLKGAQDAYADIRKTMSQRPPAGGRPAGGAGPPPSGGGPPGGAGKPSGASSSSNTNKVYDKKDTNQDGTVSAKEELTYSLLHPKDAKQDSVTIKVDSGTGSINLTA